MQTVFLIVTLLIMAVGLVGAVLPIIPSIPIIYLGYLVYGLGSGWKDYGLGMMIFWGVVTVLVLIADYFVGALGAKRYGATKFGIIGSIVGTIVGLIFLNIFGLIIGPFVGAMGGEILAGRSLGEATRSGWGTFVGFVAGSLFKIMVACAMIGSFLLMLVN